MRVRAMAPFYLNAFVDYARIPWFRGSNQSVCAPISSWPGLDNAMVDTWCDTKRPQLSGVEEVVRSGGMASMMRR